ncbi:YkgJ family cysteine cluster protein [Mycobacterium sp. DL99]|uniref:YkgJ family cysteine cluster protein n=1 Tax=Mycobacterium sp. DL99 TaxID=2528957 RepID=UPI00336C0730
MADSLERIYRSVPTVACKGLCAEACGPIGMSEEERRRLLKRGVLIDGSLECPALVDDRCSVYEDRPLICRLWGAVESMPCPHGCEVTPGLLMDAGAHSLIGRSLRLDVADG